MAHDRLRSSRLASRDVGPRSKHGGDLRRVAAVVVAAAGLVVGLAVPSSAADVPTAKQLVQKLVDEDVCDGVHLVDAAQLEVTCRTDSHGRLPIRVTAFLGHRGLVKGLRRHIDKTCAQLEQLPLTSGPETFALVVGPTWYASAEPAFNKAIVRRIGGKVKRSTCT